LTCISPQIGASADISMYNKNWTYGCA
jgi:hypothetical protein